MEFPIPLNKFEKEEKVIELHKQGKTIKQIAAIVHKNFRDISKIIKKYERQKELQIEREQNNQSIQIKKSSISSLAFKLFSDGKKPIDVKIELDIPFKKNMIYWGQYLKTKRLYEAYEFYQEHSNDIPALLSINTFLGRNDINGKDIVNVLRTAKDVANLNQILSNLKTEIEKLKQIKNNYSLNQNIMMGNPPLPPLEPLPRYFNW